MMFPVLALRGLLYLSIGALALTAGMVAQPSIGATSPPSGIPVPLHLLITLLDRSRADIELMLSYADMRIVWSDDRGEIGAMNPKSPDSTFSLCCMSTSEVLPCQIVSSIEIRLQEGTVWEISVNSRPINVDDAWQIKRWVGSALCSLTNQIGEPNDSRVSAEWMNASELTDSDHHASSLARWVRYDLDGAATDISNIYLQAIDKENKSIVRITITRSH